jgi:isoaspartyl peptidase/L-asparaginase-like protein (Ntn-hydrolase superfamily)
MSKQAMSKQQQAEYEAKLEEALTAGEKLLKKGATAADAVVEAIRIMEDSPCSMQAKVLYSQVKAKMNWMPPLWKEKH